MQQQAGQRFAIRNVLDSSPFTAHRPTASNKNRALKYLPCKASSIMARVIAAELRQTRRNISRRASSSVAGWEIVLLLPAFFLGERRTVFTVADARRFLLGEGLASALLVASDGADFTVVVISCSNNACGRKK